MGVCKHCNKRGHLADKCHKKVDSKIEANRATEEKTKLKKIATDKAKKSAKRKEQKREKLIGKPRRQKRQLIQAETILQLNQNPNNQKKIVL